jgi:secondary thiamine-phosphate synthase enzyme
MELNKVIPFKDQYRHTEGNSPAHIKASLLGCSQTVFVEAGKLALGTWQGIFFCEFDGPRNRKVFVKVISNSR